MGYKLLSGFKNGFILKFSLLILCNLGCEFCVRKIRKLCDGSECVRQSGECCDVRMCVSVCIKVQ